MKRQTNKKKSMRTDNFKRVFIFIITPLLLLIILLPFILNSRQDPRQNAAGTQASFIPMGMRAVPDPLYGVTIDTVNPLADIVTSLSKFSHKPTVRIVFDEGQQPSTYAQAVMQIQPVGYILGMIADSTAIGQYTAPQYAQRATDYLNAFGSQVDIWEVGNEINGEWLGSDVPAKMTNAYNVFKTAGKRTALTLYYNGLDDNQNCYSNKNNLMFRWAQANVPETMKQGLDYVFISFYEQDCPGVSKDWNTVFMQLHQMFPNAKIGFGENGTTKPTDPQSLKLQYINEYYPVWVDVPCYTAGHFWWNYANDYKDSTVWNALNTAMNNLTVPQTNNCGSTTVRTLEAITPTLVCLGSCPSSAPTVQPSVAPTQPERAQQEVVATTAPTQNIESQPSTIISPTNPSPRQGSNQSFLQLLIAFIRQLLEFFKNLF
jgi:hypothetical protein